ncbi:MAG: AAA family ATPase [Marmoricola sp.]
MPVIIDHDTARATALAAEVGQGSHVVTTVEQVENWLGRRPNEYAVVVGPEVDLSAAMSMADGMRLLRPALSVILLRETTTTELMSSAMHAGVREVVSSGDPKSLGAAIGRARQTFDAIHGPSASDANTGKVLTIFSPKGGVGKTTMSVNLALALCDNGTNRVCLLDLDLSFGDVAITLQLVPEHTIAEAVEVEDHLDDSMLQKLLTRHDSGLMVMAAPTHPDAKDQITTALVRRVITGLRMIFDYVVIDTSPGFDDQVLAAFDETDECVILATLDVPTIKNVKMSLETLDLLNLSLGHRWLVLNRADEEVGLTPSNVEEILGAKIAATFPSSLDVANATNHGRPIVLTKPDHRVSRAIRGLAKDLSTPDQERRPLALAGTSKRRFSRRK